jgi:hypothetical protein
MAAFNKSNWTRLTDAPNMIQYFPSGIPNVAVNANSTTTLTLTSAFKFKGNGPIDVSFAAGSTQLNNGLSLGIPILQGPAAGSYAAGNHPRIQIPLSNFTAGGLTPTAIDLIATQF